MLDEGDHVVLHRTTRRGLPNLCLRGERNLVWKPPPRRDLGVETFLRASHVKIDKGAGSSTVATSILRVPHAANLLLWVDELQVRRMDRHQHTTRLVDATAQQSVDEVDPGATHLFGIPSLLTFQGRGGHTGPNAMGKLRPSFAAIPSAARRMVSTCSSPN